MKEHKITKRICARLINIEIIAQYVEEDGTKEVDGLPKVSTLRSNRELNLL